MTRHSDIKKWMEAYKAKYGIYPIAGGDGDNIPPDALVVPDEPAPVTETPPAQTGFQQGQAENGNGNSRVFTEDDVAKIRKEEKDKLYSRVEELQNELKAIREAEAERTRLAEEEAARKAAEAQAKAEEEMGVRDLLAKKEQEWQDRFNQIQQDMQNKDAILEKERQFATLIEYKTRRLAEEEDSIMPELRDLIGGDSQEEVEASINTMKERTSRILEQVKQFHQQQRQQMPGVKPTAPPLGPIEENDSANKTLTAADIQAMSMNDYIKNRERLMQAVSNKARSQGIYG